MFDVVCVATFSCGVIEQLSDWATGREKERACVEQVVRVWPEGGRGGEKRSRLLPSPHHLPLLRSSLGGSFPARAFKEMPYPANFSSFCHFFFFPQNKARDRAPRPLP